MIKTGPSRGEAEKDALSLCSHHVLVKGGDTRVLAAGYPYIHKAKGEDAKEMEGQEPDIQHQKPQPVSAHHGGRGAQDPVGGQTAVSPPMTGREAMMESVGITNMYS